MSNDFKLPEKEIKRRKKIGDLKGRTVFGIETVGGYHVVAAQAEKGKNLEILGGGNHPAISRFIAEKHSPGINYTLLEKGDYLNPLVFADIIHEWEAFTNDLRVLQGLPKLG